MTQSNSEMKTIGKIEFSENNEIGRTALSTVFRGRYERSIDVAIKRISFDLARFAENEIRMLLKETDQNVHANVIRYYCNEIEDSKFWYIAMELCACSLEKYIEKPVHYSNLPSASAQDILRGAAEGLAHIHKLDIVHRDIKPSNILLFVNDNKLIAKISDFGISRKVPVGQTTMANFSAGTDFYKAPELLNPQFSWRSDVYAFGLVVFYALSNGEHLFNKVVDHMIEGKPVNIDNLNGQSSALSLVKWLTTYDQEARPRMSEVAHHPFFWNDEKNIDFIKDLNTITTDPKSNSLNEAIEKNSHEVICRLPENCGNMQNPPNPGACADWISRLTDEVREDIRDRKTPVTYSCVDLVRNIRNKLEHFNEVRALYGGTYAGFRRYWLERFPSLVVHLWETVELTHVATREPLKKYYAPESVRRTNFESALLRTIREGKLREPQELFNKVQLLRDEIKAEAGRSAVERENKERQGSSGTYMKYKGEGSLLHEAAREDNEDFAQFLISSMAEVDRRNEWGKTPLHVAATCGSKKVAKLLIKHGAKVKCEDNNKSIPLYFAARMGNLEVVKLLVEERDAGVEYSNKWGHTPLHGAVERGHRGIVEFLISEGAHVDCTDQKSNTPLHSAAQNGDREIAELLIKRGAQMDCENEDGWTPLDMAFEYDRAIVARLLIKHGAKINYKEVGGITLHKAARNGQVEVTQLLIENKADINYKNLSGDTPLHEALKYDRVKVAELLIKKGAAVNNENNDGCTPLHIASQRGHISVAQKLIEKSGDVKCQNKYGRTPLHEAAQNGHLEVAQLLIVPERGTDVNCKDNDENTALHVASQYGHTEVAQFLIEKAGADVNCQNKEGRTPLHEAAQNGHLEVARLLVVPKHDTDVNCKDNDGNTALHVALKYGRVEVAQLLAGNGGADVKCQNKDGRTPLHYAARNASEDMVRLLLDGRAEVNCEDEFGRTPLHEAAQNGYVDVARLLIQSRATINCKDKDGRTPLDCAKERGDEGMVELLEQFTTETSQQADHVSSP